MKTYAINEIFDTLQGEGVRAGARSVFLRFSGCNLWDGNPEHRYLGKGACARWCDTDFAQGERLPADEILKQMDELWPQGGPHRWCVLTGGEPLLQLDMPLVGALRGAGWRIAVETNGSVEAKPGVLEALALLTVSPKRGAKLVLKFADELKVVLPGDEERPWTDGDLAAAVEQLVPTDLFVQPQDPINPKMVQMSHLHNSGAGSSRAQKDAYEENLQTCIGFIRRNPMWRLSLQLHKFAGLP